MKLLNLAFAPLLSQARLRSVPPQYSLRGRPFRSSQGHSRCSSTSPRSPIQRWKTYPPIKPIGIKNLQAGFSGLLRIRYSRVRPRIKQALTSMIRVAKREVDAEALTDHLTRRSIGSSVPALLPTQQTNITSRSRFLRGCAAGVALNIICVGVTQIVRAQGRFSTITRHASTLTWRS